MNEGEGIEAVPVPKVGDEIYVDTSLFLSHGKDDVMGGRARVSEVILGVSEGKPCHYVVVDEQPGWQQNWTTYLALIQEELRAKFGDERAHPSQDHRPKFNEF